MSCEESHYYAKKRRGAVLVAILLLLLILFVMGLTILGLRNTQAKSSLMMQYAKVAKFVAQAGMENARIKLYKDIDFPPRNSTEDYFFSYSEELRYPGDSEPAGEYIITVDSSKDDPSLVSDYDRKIIVTSEGIVRDSEGKIKARHKIRGILDTSPTVRGATNPNPYLYKYVDWQDYGSI